MATRTTLSAKLDVGGRLTRFQATLPAPGRGTVLAVRPATPIEHSGRRYLTRASGATAFGGAVLTLFTSGIFANLSQSMVGTTGMLIGMALIAIGMVTWVDPAKRKMPAGAAAIVLGVLSLPFSIGGLVVGALSAVIGGALLVAYEPPTGPMVVETRRGGLLQRIAAAIIDFTLVLILQITVGRLIPGVNNGTEASNTISVLIAWILCWSLAVLVPAVMVRRTLGRLVVGLRVVDLRTGGRVETVPTVIRELTRAVLTIGSFIVCARVFSDHGFWAAMLALWFVVAATVLLEWFDVVDRFTGSTVGHDVAAPLINPNEMGPTQVVARLRPAR